VSEQLTLDLDVPVVAALPRPSGLVEIELDGVPYLNDVGDEHPSRVFGWYYGYPPCCIEAFIARDERFRVAHRQWLDRQPRDAPMLGTDDDPRPEWEQRPHHPVSGHLLCPACEAGPIALLPPHPAERCGFVHWDEDDEPYLEPPSLYDWTPAA
jgi:hypothetical protein